MVPPAAEPLSVDDAKAHLRIDHDSDDGLIAAYIAVARDRAEQFLNRALISRTMLFTLSPSSPPTPQLGYVFNPVLLALPLGWPQILQQPIELPMPPVQSVTQVQQRHRDGTTITLDPASAYYADTVNEPARITLRTVGQPVGSDLGVTYVAGYGDTPNTVPVSIVHAIKLILTFLYENRGDTDGEMPRAAETLLWPYRMVTFGG